MPGVVTSNNGGANGVPKVVGVIEKKGVVKDEGVVKKRCDVKAETLPRAKKKNAKSSDGGKPKKKSSVSCLQCIKPVKDDGGLEGKYRVAAPELMQDTFMSDSEDEGGEVECPIQQQQQYRYMNSEVGTLHRAKPLEDSVTDGHLWPSNNDKKTATVDRQPLDIGFLVSFVVDARGGAMRAKRRGGVRVVVPPAACAAPTRVTCRAATRRAPASAPPPLMEGEALASRLLELQPQGAKFLAPVIIEVPIFTSTSREREIVILRSDTGETWQDHYLHNNDNPLIQEALAKERLEHGNTGEAIGESGERVTRIITCDFPHYLAVVSRVRQEVHIIGPEGGTISSAAIPQVQAQFPAAALTKRIRVGLQAHGAAAALASRLLPRLASASAVLTVEPRRRKFHRCITLTAPLPQPQGVITEKPNPSNLRLLCSIMGGQAKAVWEDVTGSTPLTLTDQTASFTTTVSARFWLMNCQSVTDATKLATELYKEMLLVPFEVRIVVLAKRLDALEGRLLVLYITDRYNYDTLLHQEHYTEVAASTSVTLLDGKDVYLEFSGNLVPVTKSGTQPTLHFEAFKDNRVEFPVRVKHHEETPTGRVYFMNEPKVAKGEQSQSPACVLDVELPDRVVPRADKSHIDYLNLDQSGFDALKDELSFHWGDHNNSLGPSSLPNHYNGHINGHDKVVANGDVKKVIIEKEPTPPAAQNGDSLHVDSNKTKATFDSDEDKTPFSTLEKNKKKPAPPTSFIGGLADKVKHVFGSSDDDEDIVHDEAPKPKPRLDEPPPKPDRQSPPKPERQSPPKPAPRFIKEDLLDKVEDMFKDLHGKPKHRDEEDDVASHVYETKLVVDEDHTPKEVNKIKENPYKNVKPVVEEPCIKVIAKKRPSLLVAKDEFGNIVEEITDEIHDEHENKVDHLSQGLENNINSALNDIEKEKENLKHQSNALSQDVVDKYDKVKNELCQKQQNLETSFNNKIDDTQKDIHDRFNDFSDSLFDTKDNVNVKIETGKSVAKKNVDDVSKFLNKTHDDLLNEAQNIGSSIKQNVHFVKNTGDEKLDDIFTSLDDAKENIKDKANNLESDLKHKADSAKSKANDVVNTGIESLHDIQDDLHHKVQDIKTDIQTKEDEIKHKTHETIDHLNQSVDGTKHSVQTELKEKADEGRNFFSGLVHNIFGEKEKLESNVNDKIAKGKDTTDKLMQQASDKKDDSENSIVRKEQKFQDGADDLVQRACDKKNELKLNLTNTTDKLIQQASDKKDELENSIVQKEQELKHNADDLVQRACDKKDELKLNLTNTTDKLLQQTSDKKDELENSIAKKEQELKEGAADLVQKARDKKNEVKFNLTDKKNELQDATESHLDRIRQEAEHTTDEIKRSAEETLNAAADKKADIHSKVANKTEKLMASGEESVKNAKQVVSEKVNDIKQSTKEEFDDIQESTLSSFDSLERSTKEKVQDAHDTWEDLQSSTRDTYADLKDDVHGLENSAQDTLHSFQSSAGNTFDSLDDSAKEFLGGLQNTTSSAVGGTKDFFGLVGDSVQTSFEGFKLSADNKLEDIKSDTNELVHDVSEKVEESKGVVTKGAQQATEAVGREADKFTTDLNNLGSDVFGAASGFMKADASSKLLESEKSQASPPQKKSSGIPKLKKKNRK